MSKLGELICDLLQEDSGEGGRCELGERLAKGIESAGRWMSHGEALADKKLRTIVGEVLNRETSMPFKDTVTIAEKIEAAIRERCHLNTFVFDIGAQPEPLEVWVVIAGEGDVKAVTVSKTDAEEICKILKDNDWPGVRRIRKTIKTSAQVKSDWHMALINSALSKLTDAEREAVTAAMKGGKDDSL